MKKKFTDFYEAWHWLDDHPIFKEEIFFPGRKFPNSHNWFHQGLYIMVVKVDPKTNRVKMVKGQKYTPDESRNTKTCVWLEHGPFEVVPAEEAGGVEWRGCSHDMDLDCGGETFEEAVIKLANLVLKKYKDYEQEEISDEHLEEIMAVFDQIKNNSK